MDLTWFCKKDFDLKVTVISSPLVLTLTKSIFLIGDFEEQDAALNEEKS